MPNDAAMTAEDTSRLLEAMQETDPHTRHAVQQILDGKRLGDVARGDAAPRTS